MACIAIQRHKTQTTLTKENPKITPRNPHAQPSPTCNKPSKRLHSSAHIVESHCRLVPTIPSIQKGSIRTGLMRFWHLGAKTTPIVAHVLLILMFPCLWVITPIIPPSYPPHCYPSPKTQKPLLIKKQHQHISTWSTINPINPMDLPRSTKKTVLHPLDRTQATHGSCCAMLFGNPREPRVEPDAGCPLRLLGPRATISWENKPYFGWTCWTFWWKMSCLHFLWMSKSLGSYFHETMQKGLTKTSHFH